MMPIENHPQADDVCLSLRKLWRGFPMHRYYLTAMLLAGWYLMVPPPKVFVDHFEINFSAPLYKWTQLRRFDSASQCDAARQFYANHPEDLSHILDSREQATAAMRAAKCLSTRDPRLQQN
jgi:hypothetical protein